MYTKKKLATFSQTSMAKETAAAIKFTYQTSLEAAARQNFSSCTNQPPLLYAPSPPFSHHSIRIEKRKNREKTQEQRIMVIYFHRIYAANSELLVFLHLRFLIKTSCKTSIASEPVRPVFSSSWLVIASFFLFV